MLYRKKKNLCVHTFQLKKKFVSKSNWKKIRALSLSDFLNLTRCDDT